MKKKKISRRKNSPKNEQQTTNVQSEALVAQHTSKIFVGASVLLFLCVLILIKVFLLNGEPPKTSNEPIDVIAEPDIPTPPVYSPISSISDSTFILALVDVFLLLACLAFLQQMQEHRKVLGMSFESFKNAGKLMFIVPLFLTCLILFAGVSISLLKESLRTPAYYYYMVNVALLPIYFVFYVYMMGIKTAMEWTPRLFSGLYNMTKAALQLLSFGGMGLGTQNLGGSASAEKVGNEAESVIPNDLEELIKEEFQKDKYQITGEAVSDIEKTLREIEDASKPTLQEIIGAPESTNSIRDLLRNPYAPPGRPLLRNAQSPGLFDFPVNSGLHLPVNSELHLPLHLPGLQVYSAHPALL